MFVTLYRSRYSFHSYKIFWDNALTKLILGLQMSINKFHTINCKILLLFLQILCPSTAKISNVIFEIIFELDSESFISGCSNKKSSRKVKK